MPKILVVEDESIIAMTTSLYLERMGHEVIGVTESGHKAVDIARQVKPDLVLMDIVLRGDMDGIRAAELIKAEHDCPVVFISGSPEALSNGVSGNKFLPKPFSSQQLEVMLQRVIGPAKLSS